MSDTDPAHEAQRLAVLRETGLLTLPPPPELDEICQGARERLGTAIAMVTLVWKDTILVRGRAGTSMEVVPRFHQFCEETIKDNAVLVVPDAARDPRFAANAVVTGEPFIRFYAGAPLVYVRELRLGALCVLDPQPRDFSLGDRAELEAMAEDVVSVIIRREIEGWSHLPRPSS